MKKSVVCLAVISMVMLSSVFCYAEAARERPAVLALQEQDLVGIGAVNSEPPDDGTPGAALLIKKIESRCVGHLYITNNTDQDLDVSVESISAGGVMASYNPSSIKLQAGAREVISLEFDKAPAQGSTLTCMLGANRMEGSVSICYCIAVSVAEEYAQE